MKKNFETFAFPFLWAKKERAKEKKRTRKGKSGKGKIKTAKSSIITSLIFFLSRIGKY